MVCMCVCIYIYICNGILFSHKKKILPFGTIWMNLEGNMVSERSQIEKDKYCMLSLICGIQIKVKPIETESRKVVVRG